MLQMQNEQYLEWVLYSCALQIICFCPAIFLQLKRKKIRVLLLPIKSATPISAKLVCHPNAN